jgi:hypothetical protein
LEARKVSILIKGMEMPKSCFDCPCYHHKTDDGYYDYEICRASGTVFNDGYSSVTGHKDHIDPFKARLDNCPLVPVLPHGRLIDADAAVANRYAEMNWCYDLADLPDYLADCPTIIPAEEGE